MKPETEQKTTDQRLTWSWERGAILGSKVTPSPGRIAFTGGRTTLGISKE